MRGGEGDDDGQQADEGEPGGGDEGVGQPAVRHGCAVTATVPTGPQWAGIGSQQWTGTGSQQWTGTGSQQ